MIGEARAAQLKAMVEAFSEQAPPAREALLLPNGGLEGEEIQAALSGRGWQSLSNEELHQLSGALFFLSPEAVRFYLPAWMSYCVRDLKGADVLVDEVLQVLTPPVAGAATSHEAVRFAETFGGLSADAKVAVLGFLEFLVAYHEEEFWGEPARAIARYWGEVAPR